MTEWRRVPSAHICLIFFQPRLSHLASVFASSCITSAQDALVNCGGFEVPECLLTLILGDYRYLNLLQLSLAWTIWKQTDRTINKHLSQNNNGQLFYRRLFNKFGLLTEIYGTPSDEEWKTSLQILLSYTFSDRKTKWFYQR